MLAKLLYLHKICIYHCYELKSRTVPWYVNIFVSHFSDKFIQLRIGGLRGLVLENILPVIATLWQLTNAFGD